MIIKYNDIKIRSANIKDTATLASWWNNGKVMAHAGFPNGLGLKEEDVLKQITEYKYKKREVMIIEIKDVLIGEMSYRINGEIAEIGIKICLEEYQSKGLGPQILRLLISYLFECLHVRKVILDTNSNNIRAQKCYEKLNFRKLRININSWKDQLGNYQSSIDYEMTFDDYQKYYII